MLLATLAQALHPTVILAVLREACQVAQILRAKRVASMQVVWVRFVRRKRQCTMVIAPRFEPSRLQPKVWVREAQRSPTLRVNASRARVASIESPCLIVSCRDGPTHTLGARTRTNAYPAVRLRLRHADRVDVILGSFRPTVRTQRVKSKHNAEQDSGL